MRYFLKEILSTRLYLTSGAVAKWEPVQDDQGVMETESEPLIEQLSIAIQRRVGGVVEITKTTYDELKKNSLTISESSLSSISADGARRVISTLQARIDRLEGRAAEDSMKKAPPTPHISEPLAVPDLEPLTMKAKKPAPKVTIGK